MIIRGRIQDKSSETKKSQKTGNPYTRGVFTIEGKKFSTFDAKIIDKFNEGQEVEVETQLKNGYENMISMKLCDSIPEQTAQQSVPEQRTHARQSLASSTDRRIARMNALTNAVKLTSQIEKDKPNVFNVAEDMFKWIMEIKPEFKDDSIKQ